MIISYFIKHRIHVIKCLLACIAHRSIIEVQVEELVEVFPQLVKYHSVCLCFASSEFWLLNRRIHPFRVILLQYAIIPSLTAASVQFLHIILLIFLIFLNLICFFHFFFSLQTILLFLFKCRYQWLVLIQPVISFCSYNSTSLRSIQKILLFLWRILCALRIVVHFIPIMLFILLENPLWPLAWFGTCLVLLLINLPFLFVFLGLNGLFQLLLEGKLMGIELLEVTGWFRQWWFSLM